MLSNIKILCHYVRERMELLSYRHILPDKTQHDDLYIVEFPKSGITWFSTIISNTCFLEEGINLEATHFNLEQFIGDVHVTSSINYNYNNFPYHRIIKSHAEYNPYYRHVIYLIRNPFSVMNSYYHYSTCNGFYEGGFETFVKNNDLGITKWITHVNSWMNPRKALKLHVIRYEDLLDAPEDTLTNLYKNLGWKISNSIKVKSLELSEFSRMKEFNDLYKKYCPFRKYDFIRKGKKQPEITKTTHKYIYEKSEHILKEFYPELLVPNRK